jgi:hypothetical protein
MPRQQGKITLPDLQSLTGRSTVRAAALYVSIVGVRGQGGSRASQLLGDLLDGSWRLSLPSRKKHQLVCSLISNSENRSHNNPPLTVISYVLSATSSLTDPCYWHTATKTCCVQHIYTHTNLSCPCSIPLIMAQSFQHPLSSSNCSVTWRLCINVITKSLQVHE